MTTLEDFSDSAHEYRPRLQEQAATLLEEAGAQIEQSMREGRSEFEESFITRVHGRLTSADTLDLLERSYFLITLLIGTELDTGTPGNVGLGRTKAEPPRLGGAFAAGAVSSEETHAALGPRLEDLMIRGFASGAVYDACLEGPGRISWREHDQLRSFWISRMRLGYLEGETGVFELASAAAADQIFQFIAEAEQAGLLHHLHKATGRETLGRIGAFHVSAGAELYAVSSSRQDEAFSEYERLRTVR